MPHQDWCVAAGEGVAVPDVHLVWCCRYMAEMELVGEAIPSMLARAGEAKNTHVTMSLYCSKVRALASRRLQVLDLRRNVGVHSLSPLTRLEHDGVLRLVQAMSARLVKTRRAKSRYFRDAKVFGHTTAAMHDMSCDYTPPPLSISLTARPCNQEDHVDQPCLFYVQLTLRPRCCRSGLYRLNLVTAQQQKREWGPQRDVASGQHDVYQQHDPRSHHRQIFHRFQPSS